MKAVYILTCNAKFLNILFPRGSNCFILFYFILFYFKDIVEVSMLDSSLLYDV